MSAQKGLMVATAYLFKELVSEICGFHRIKLSHRHRVLLNLFFQALIEQNLIFEHQVYWQPKLSIEVSYDHLSNLNICSFFVSECFRTLFSDFNKIPREML